MALKCLLNPLFRIDVDDGGGNRAVSARLLGSRRRDLSAPERPVDPLRIPRRFGYHQQARAFAAILSAIVLPHEGNVGAAPALSRFNWCPDRIRTDAMRQAHGAAIDVSVNFHNQLRVTRWKRPPGVVVENQKTGPQLHDIQTGSVDLSRHINLRGMADLVRCQVLRILSK